MAKTRIAVDIDDVLTGLHDLMRVWANEKTNSSLTEGDYTVHGDYWGYYERIWESHDLHHLLRHDDFLDDVNADRIKVPLLPGAQFAIKELMKTYDVILLTARPKYLETVTRKWVADQLGDDIKVYFAKNFYRDDNTKSKGEMCIELGATVLIDDAVDHCRSAVENGIEAILFGDYGWQHTIPEKIIQCKDWPAVLEYLDGRAK